MRHRTRPHYGVQFHPESIGTQWGHRLLSNFRDLTLRRRRRAMGEEPKKGGKTVYVEQVRGGRVGGGVGG